MNDNVFRLASSQKDEQSIPESDYILYDLNNNGYEATGFLIFTTHHVVVMKNVGPGAVPALVLPMSNFKFAELIEDEDAYLEEYSPDDFDA